VNLDVHAVGAFGRGVADPINMLDEMGGVVDTLVKVISALERAGIELIGENAPSVGAGRGVRLKETLSGDSLKQVPSMMFDQAPGANGGAA